MNAALKLARLSSKLKLSAIKNPCKDSDPCKDTKDPRLLVPEHFHEFLHVFENGKAQELPPHRTYDHSIPLKPDSAPPFGQLYDMSQKEFLVLKEYIEENLAKGFIRQSSSPAGAPIQFVKKADSSLCICVDYRGLNEMTIKNWYPLPLIPETLACLQKVRWYTKLDLRNGYYHLRFAEGEEWNTAFWTRYGHFEYQVMPFGLTNALGSFQHFINYTIQDFLDVFCTAFHNDILIYSSTLKVNKDHVRLVLERLAAAGIHLNPDKCKFHIQEVDYLGLVITPGGLKMQDKKVATIRDWEDPENVKDVQSFLGFANFYRRFIHNYSKVVTLMTKLTGKSVPWQWETEQRTAFQALKDAFTFAPILQHFDYKKEIVVETDASDYVSAGVMSQPDDHGILRPVAFFSKKHSPAECNYEIYEEELLAIMRSFEEWCPQLIGVA